MTLTLVTQYFHLSWIRIVFVKIRFLLSLISCFCKIIFLLIHINLHVCSIWSRLGIHGGKSEVGGTNVARSVTIRPDFFYSVRTFMISGGQTLLSKARWNNTFKVYAYIVSSQKIHMKYMYNNSYCEYIYLNNSLSLS